MKHFFKLTCAAAVLTATTIALPSFKPAKKTTANANSQSIKFIPASTSGPEVHIAAAR